MMTIDPEVWRLIETTTGPLGTGLLFLYVMGSRMFNRKVAPVLELVKRLGETVYGEDNKPGLVERVEKLEAVPTHVSGMPTPVEPVAAGRSRA